MLRWQIVNILSVKNRIIFTFNFNSFYNHFILNDMTKLGHHHLDAVWIFYGDFKLNHQFFYLVGVQYLVNINRPHIIYQLKRCCTFWINCDRRSYSLQKQLYSFMDCKFPYQIPNLVSIIKHCVYTTHKVNPWEILKIGYSFQSNFKCK